jgi:hypothetical protein
MASVAITRGASVAETAERLRALAGGVLRRRYYMEGDWRGEIPLDIRGGYSDEDDETL